ncbi:MAG TPA: S8 family serine peptidase [Candidatus Polarisedimenticolaceae bacterium]|nr:S8 family serine peptidase [Candidatus Polarisedimenticolaceae bacterium]
MRVVTSFLSLLCAVSLTHAARPELRLAGGTFRPGAKAETAAATSPRGQRYLVAVTREALDPDDRAALAAAGAEVLDVLPVHGYRVRLSPEAEGDVRRLPFVVWLGPLPDRFKVLPEVAAAAAGTGETAVRVILAAAEPPARVLALLSGLDTVATPAGPHGAWRVQVALPAGRLAALLPKLSALPEVDGIEPARRARLLNQDAVWVHQSFIGPSPQQTPIFARGIFGCGQILATADSAQDHDLCFFRDTVNGAPPIATCASPPCPAAAPGNRRKDILYYNWSGGPIGEADTCPATITGTSGHGTHTSGSLAGDNTPYADCTGFTTANRNGGDGQAPGAKLVVQELGDGLEYLNDLGGTVWNLADVAFQTGARIQSFSWGSACHDLFGNCIPGCTMPYDSFARDADLAMWAHPDLLLVAAAGNAGEFCPAPISVGTPGLAKSLLTVGALGHGTSASFPSSFSSPGPVEDGRLKPTVAAEGEAVVSAASDAVIGSNNCGSCSLDGSSMSAPIAAGLAALVREYYTAGFYATGARNAGAGFVPSGALLKATLIDGSVPLGPAAPQPDFDAGYGRILLSGTLAFTGSPFSLRVDDRREGLVTGGVVEHAYDVAAGTPFRATLVWSDYPAALNAASTRVNELELEVIDPTGTRWFQTLDGNGLPLRTANPAAPHDAVNVEERLVFDAPQAGRWIVRVLGVDVPWGPQPFALVVRGALTDCPSPPAPAAPALSTPAQRQVQVSWSTVSGAVAYDVYRSLGGCSAGSFVPVASAIPGTSFLDTTVSGGVTYGYAVAAASDTAGACESPRSACVPVVPTGDCTLAPAFGGVASAESAGLATCTVHLAWSAATPYCAGDVRYNVYRGTAPGFVPGPANRVASCLTGSGWDDATGLVSGQTYWYVVRAEDASPGHGGPCRGGNEEANTVRASAAPFGLPATGTWTDDAGDTGTATLGTVSPWTVDLSGGRTGSRVYVAESFAGACADVTTPALTLADPGEGPQLTFWTKHDLEYDPTGEIFGTEGSLGQVEIAIGPGFSNWSRVPLTPNYPNPVDFPFNDCPTTQQLTRYFTGTQLTYQTYTASLVNWAGGDVKLRFHLSGDYLYPGGHWWIDDLAVTGALVPGTCTTGAAGPPPIPNLTVAKSGGNVVVTWNAASCPATAVNLYRGSLGSFGAFTGGTCGLPASGSATVTLPGNVWFLLAATDGAATDGSYGLTGTGAERVISGASTACPGTTQHVTTGNCP